MISYELLRVIWWLLMGFLLAGFAVMDGFDLGVAMLLPVIGKSDTERRIMLNTIGPVWEGNQVWFILGGGVLFAAWPYLYAVSFSGFYLAMFLLLVTFILRPVGFKYRSKLKIEKWRLGWDGVLSACGLISALIFGVAVGNTLQGVPFQFDNDLRSFYTGTLWQLFNPFAILCGLVSVAMIAMQGAHYLITKTEAAIQARAIKTANVAALLLILLFAGGGLWITWGIKGYVLLNALPSAPSHPIDHNVITQAGAWLGNYYRQPILILSPLLVFFAALAAIVFSRVKQGKLAFVFSSISTFFVVVTVGVSMFPFILPSSTQMGSSLTVWNASASQFSLTIMLLATIIFMPIVLLYTSWVYRVLRGKVTTQFLDTNKNAY